MTMLEEFDKWCGGMYRGLHEEIASVAWEAAWETAWQAATLAERERINKDFAKLCARLDDLSIAFVEHAAGIRSGD